VFVFVFVFVKPWKPIFLCDSHAICLYD